MLKKTAIFFVLVMLFLCAACSKEAGVAPATTPENAETQAEAAPDAKSKNVEIKAGDVEAFLRGENKELMEVLDVQQ